MNVERMKALSTYLRQYTGPFNLSGWTECACAIACRMPEFKLLGLESLYGVPLFQHKERWEAVEAFFGLTAKQAKRLFTSDFLHGASTASDVADHIDYMLCNENVEHKELIQHSNGIQQSASLPAAREAVAAVERSAALQ